jgi:hypothetical protein
MGIIPYILTVTLFSFGWSNLFNEGMIFERVGKALEPLPSWIKKPLYDCPICNSVWVAVVMYFTIWPEMEWWKLPLIGLSASGLASIITGFQNKLKDIADVIEN